MSTLIHSAEVMATTVDQRPLVTVVLPAFNEAAILERNLAEIFGYLRSLDSSYRWEVIIVNDGSSDATGAVADSLRARYPNLIVIHHVTNFGLGQAFKTAFARSRGEYVVTLDIDLSYSPEHIGLLLERIIASRAKLVLASPYMKGGKLSQVPWMRIPGASRYSARVPRGFPGPGPMKAGSPAPQPSGSGLYQVGFSFLSTISKSPTGVGYWGVPVATR